jgi:hypothetical protein
MATILDDTKINGMLGAVNNAVGTASGSISQVEQWNSLAQNVNGILEKIMSMKAKQPDAPVQQNQQIIPQSQAPVGQIMQDKIIPANQQVVQAPSQPNIYIDNAMLKKIILDNFLKLKNLPDDIKTKPISELIALAEQNQAMLDAILPMIAVEIKGCVKWT